jgi:type II secretory pathway predicted ATPase ExeA
MYETHFGLKKRPFRALAAGGDVFVGPQTAAIMAGLKKALAAQDSIVVVSGPIGIGKTTLVRHALRAIGDKQFVISVGRMPLGHDEVLELLLEEMGAELPAGTVQRFTAFRRLLKEHAEQGSRVIVVVEDAGRIGPDALSELEALTAADAGVSDGANIVLMGDPDVPQLLNKPRLARLKQRLRLRQSIAPLGAGELTGYLKHCFRLAGKEYDTLFAEGSAAALHGLSDGIPRMTNNLVESVLTAAAEAKMDQVTVSLIKRVAIDEYGLEVSGVEPAPDHHIRERRVEERRVTDRRDQAPKVAQPDSGKPAAAAQAPAPVAAPANDDSDEIPELIQDTLPDLAVLAPALATELPPETPPRRDVPEVAQPKSDSELDTDISAALEAAQVGMSDDEIPEWERDPTLAELRPDLDALEHAMLVAQGLAPGSDGEANPDAAAEEPAEPVPEITLDREIQAKIDEATEILKRAEEEAEEQEPAEGERADDSDKPTSEILAAANKQRKADANSIESQLDATDAFAIDKIAAVAAAEQAAEAAAPEPELPVLETPVAPAAKAPSALPAEKPVPPPIVEAPTLPVNEKPTPPPVLKKRVAPPVVEKPATPPVIEKPVAPPVLKTPAPPVDKKPTPPPVDEAPAPAAAEKKPDLEMQQIAADLSRAKTIEDVDDKMAETLFGEEFSLMAAEVAANAPPELSANDDFELSIEESATVPAVDVEGAAAVNVESGPQSQPQPKPQSRPKPPPTLQGGSPDLAATQQRLATVRALNAGTAPAMPEPQPESIVLSEGGGPSPPQPDDDHPETIEEQINTSITQTLKALSVRPPPTATDDDDDEEKGGFFSRFRRS